MMSCKFGDKNNKVLNHGYAEKTTTLEALFIFVIVAMAALAVGKFCCMTLKIFSTTIRSLRRHPRIGGVSRQAGRFAAARMIRKLPH
jgi:hypothetical protein